MISGTRLCVITTKFKLDIDLYQIQPNLTIITQPLKSIDVYVRYRVCYTVLLLIFAVNSRFMD